MTEPKLEPCPLCRQSLEAVYDHTGKGNMVVSGMRHPWSPEETCALQYHIVRPPMYAAWNTRTPPSADVPTEAPIAGMSLAEIEALANEGCNWCGGRKRVLLAMVERIREMEAKTAAAKREALEQAAKVADADYTPGYGPHRADMEYLAEKQRRDIAYRIRALSPSQNADEAQSLEAGIQRAEEA